MSPGWPDDIPPLPWTFQVGKRQLVIGSANPDLPGEVDEIVFTMNYEDGFVNSEMEMARAKFILDAVNNYYGQAGGGNVLRQQVRTKRKPFLPGGDQSL